MRRRVRAQNLKGPLTQCTDPKARTEPRRKAAVLRAGTVKKSLGCSRSAGSICITGTAEAAQNNSTRCVSWTPTASDRAQRAGPGLNCSRRCSPRRKRGRSRTTGRPRKMLPFLRKQRRSKRLQRAAEQPWSSTTTLRMGSPPLRRPEVKSPSKSDVIQADAGRVVDMLQSLGQRVCQCVGVV